MSELVETEETEQSKVESWRLHVLIEAGYPLPLAERIAGSEADLHGAVELLGQGCHPRPPPRSCSKQRPTGAAEDPSRPGRFRRLRQPLRWRS